MFLLRHAVALSSGLQWLVAFCGLGLVLAVLVLRHCRAMLVATATTILLVAIAAFGLRYELTVRVGSERLQTLAAMAARPTDPWPRGSGHAPLSLPGASPTDKAYFEPGGGFSPSAGSFGVAIWVLDAAGHRIATGDDIPLSRTQQSYGQAGAPRIDFSTPDYSGAWTIEGTGRVGLDLRDAPGAHHLEIVFRSVGPSGGPLREIQVLPDGQFLLNGRWRVSADRDARVSYLGAERAGWLKAQTRPGDRERDSAGWAALRLSLPTGAVTHLRIVDDRGGTPASGLIADGPAQFRLPGVDRRFDASANAQVQTLRQGLIPSGIAPGDPLNYPLPWLRDGGYALVAMARAGDLQNLRRLAQPLAKQDYYGGFGAEADSPGIALWALGEVSVALNDPTFDRSIWPDVVRKVQIIQEMVRAKAPIAADFSGPVVPKFRDRPDLRLVAQPAQNGLIVGRMDWHRPIFYVNALSYAGLRSASEFASRTGHGAEAKAWRESAAALQVDWNRRFGEASKSDPQVSDDRTAVSGLWPSEIASPAPYQALLEGRWARTWDEGRRTFRTVPRWTYFTLGEAHQWLRLSRPDRAWDVLSWFWDHQPAPGLYALWEGDGEENSFGLWRTTRGWVRPAGVTPHYWASAEMLLLQLAMLAEVQGPAGSATLVIGGGVPGQWLRQPFSVADIGTSAGPVSWSWDGHIVVVHTRSQLPVRLGPAFALGSKLVVVREGSR
jgi:hypothetical protein